MFVIKIFFTDFRHRSAVYRRSRHLNYLNQEDLSLRCHQCGRRYKVKQSLLKHLKNECGGQRNFVCDICKKTFTQNVSLRRHLIKNHNIYKPPKSRGRTRFN